jgi:hypothetical protein
MNDPQELLESERTEIAALEARAKELREGCTFVADYEANERKADKLEERAKSRRRTLPDFLRIMSGNDADDEAEETEYASEPEEDLESR